jgi:hypothetical protein
MIHAAGWICESNQATVSNRQQPSATASMIHAAGWICESNQATVSNRQQPSATVSNRQHDSYGGLDL